jgi:hypothetical protein
MTVSDQRGLGSPKLILVGLIIFGVISYWIYSRHEYKLVMGAIAQRDFPRLTQLFKEHPKRLNSVYGFTNSSKRTPLQEAVLRDDAELAAFLMDMGADAGGGSRSYDPPINIAVKHNNKEIVKALLKAGEEKSLSDSGRKEILKMAADDPEISSLLGQGHGN